VPSRLPGLRCCYPCVVVDVVPCGYVWTFTRLFHWLLAVVVAVGCVVARLHVGCWVVVDLFAVGCYVCCWRYPRVMLRFRCGDTGDLLPGYPCCLDVVTVIGGLLVVLPLPRMITLLTFVVTVTVVDLVHVRRCYIRYITVDVTLDTFTVGYPLLRCCRWVPVVIVPFTVDVYPRLPGLRLRCPPCRCHTPLVRTAHDRYSLRTFLRWITRLRLFFPSFGWLRGGCGCWLWLFLPLVLLAGRTRTHYFTFLPHTTHTLLQLPYTTRIYVQHTHHTAYYLRIHTPRAFTLPACTRTSPTHLTPTAHLPLPTRHHARFTHVRAHFRHLLRAHTATRHAYRHARLPTHCPHTRTPHRTTHTRTVLHTHVYGLHTPHAHRTALPRPRHTAVTFSLRHCYPHLTHRIYPVQLRLVLGWLVVNG